MIIPNAENIEVAADTLGTVEEWITEDQAKELHTAIGEEMAKKLGVSFPLSDDFEEGYQLGIQTARLMKGAI